MGQRRRRPARVVSVVRPTADGNPTTPTRGDRAWMVDIPPRRPAWRSLLQADLQIGQMGQGLSGSWCLASTDANAGVGGRARRDAARQPSPQRRDGVCRARHADQQHRCEARRFHTTAPTWSRSTAQAAAQSAAVADELASAGLACSCCSVCRPRSGRRRTEAGFDTAPFRRRPAQGASASHDQRCGTRRSATPCAFSESDRQLANADRRPDIDQLRAFAVRYLRPSGPLSALRVGNTPYILPVTARGFVPKVVRRSAELLEAIDRSHALGPATRGVPTLHARAPACTRCACSRGHWPSASAGCRSGGRKLSGHRTLAA